MKLFLILIFIVSSFSFGFSSEVFGSVDRIVTEFRDSGNNVGLGISFLFLSIIFTLLYRQGTDRLFKGFRRGSIASSIILAIMSSVALLSQFIMPITSNNPLVVIGLSILITFLIVVILGGGYFLYYQILTVERLKPIRLLLFLAFSTVYVYLLRIFIEYLGAAPSIYRGLGGAISGSLDFLSFLIFLFAILTLVTLIFSFFNSDSFMEMLTDVDDETALAKAREKKKKEEDDANIIEQLNQLKKAFGKMRTAYDEKSEDLRTISQIGDISSTLNRATQTPSTGNYSNRGLNNEPQGFTGPTNNRGSP